MAEMSRRLWWVAPLALCLAWLLSLAPAYSRGSLALFDAQLKLALPDTPRSDVAVVDIDAASVRALQAQLGPWPYRLDTHALLADWLLEMGARLVVFDIVFADAREGDAMLARSIASSARVVLAARVSDEESQVEPESPEALQRLGRTLPAHWPRTVWPVLTAPTSVLLAAQRPPARVGVVAAQPDDDGRLDRWALLHEVQGRGLPALPLAALQALEPDAPLRYANGGLQLGAHHWPLDAQGRVVLKHPARQTVATTGFLRVGAAALGITTDPALRRAFAGRVVFVGSSLSPNEPAAAQYGPLSATQRLAATTSALAADQVLHPPSRALDTVLVLIALLPAAALWRRARPDAPLDTLLAAAAAAAALMTSTLALAVWHVQSHALDAIAVIAASWTLALCTYQLQVRCDHAPLARGGAG